MKILTKDHFIYREREKIRLLIDLSDLKIYNFDRWLFMSNSLPEDYLIIEFDGTIELKKLIGCKFYFDKRKSPLKIKSISFDNRPPQDANFSSILFTADDGCVYELNNLFISMDCLLRPYKKYEENKNYLININKENNKIIIEINIKGD